jgi:2-C-methyl-D-erythritol 4-phosphate cytidylyltransferase
MKTLAIIPAGGAGRRMATGVAKQYLPLAGVPVLVHTLRAFQLSSAIDEILLAVPEGDIPEVRETIRAGQGLTKVTKIVAGGAERQDSVRNALAQAREEHGIVLIHDGVRPFVSGELIRRVVTAAREYGASTAGVPVKETVKQMDAAGWVTQTVSREGLWLTQTPQAFRLDVIRSAHERAARDSFYGTDDASLVERMGIPVRMVPGEYENIKLTTPEDLILGEVLIRRFPSETVGG